MIVVCGFPAPGLVLFRAQSSFLFFSRRACRMVYLSPSPPSTHPKDIAGARHCHFHREGGHTEFAFHETLLKHEGRMNESLDEDNLSLKVKITWLKENWCPTLQNILWHFPFFFLVFCLNIEQGFSFCKTSVGFVFASLTYFSAPIFCLFIALLVWIGNISGKLWIL